MTNLSSINQSGASAGRDIVAGDKVENHYHSMTTKASVLDDLIEKLHKEMDQSTQATTMIDALCRFHEKKAHDGVTGLEAKLRKSQREHEIDAALDHKEQFAKILEKWSMYASAQEIFVYLLARAEVEYRTKVLPEVDSLSEVQINSAIATHVVGPIVSDCGSTVFKLNHVTAMGMFYWLAEQCFVRWHK